MPSQKGFTSVQIILSILAGTIVLGGIVGGVLYFSKSTSQEPSIQQGKCGDGFCGDLERKNKSCAKDCGGDKPNYQSINNDTTTTKNEIVPDDNQLSLNEKIDGSPFGIADMYDSAKTPSFINALGVKTVRLAGPQGIIWNIVKNKGWGQSDNFFGEIYKNGMEMSVVILAEDPASSSQLSEYGSFAMSLAERYDGDGVSDAPGSPVVAYWEIDNEPDLYEPNERTPWKGENNFSETKNYASVLKTAYKAIKSANPNAKVAIAAASGGSKYGMEYYEYIFKELEKIKDNENDKFFDVFNYHFYDVYTDYAVERLKEVRDLLTKYGYGDIEIIITETSTYAGAHPFIKSNPAQTEEQQAIGLIKRYVYPITQGTSRIYWFSAQSSLVSSSGDKLLSYHTYKKMVEVLDGSDWNNIQTIQEKDGVYIYKFTKAGKPIWVAWNDNSTSKQITISGITSSSVKITEALPKYESGKEVTNYSTAFNTETKTVNGGKITITLNDVPVFVE